MDSEVSNYSDWRAMDEMQCDEILKSNPFDNKARFRLSQIWIEEEINFEDAKKLISSIQSSDPNFMISGI